MAKLLKQKHSNLDLLICNIFHGIPKDIHYHLKHQFFTLSKKPDMNIRIYTSTNDNYVKFEPNAYRPANIDDKDILFL